MNKESIVIVSSEQLDLNFGEDMSTTTNYDSAGFTTNDFIHIEPLDLTTLTSLTPNTDYSTLPGISINNVGTQTYQPNGTAHGSANFTNNANAWGATTWNFPSTDLHSTLTLNGENADIKINGKSLCKMIDDINERLAILVPNKELEQEWEDLKRLGEEYRQLETKIKDKMLVWDKLKSMPKIDI